MKLFTYEDDHWTGMDKIDDKLWLGDSGAARDYETLKANQITATFNVAIDLDTSDYVGPTIIRPKVGLIDGPGNEQETFDRAVEMLNDLIKEGHTVLIHCHAGVSRSPTVAATWLAEKKGWSLDRAIEYIGAIRPIIFPKPALTKLGMKYLGEM